MQANFANPENEKAVLAVFRADRETASAMRGRGFLQFRQSSIRSSSLAYPFRSARSPRRVRPAPPVRIFSDDMNNWGCMRELFFFALLLSSVALRAQTVISNVYVAILNRDDTTIVWTTNTPSTSQILYEPVFSFSTQTT